MQTNRENQPSKTPGPMASLQPDQSNAPEISNSNRKAVVVGLYGIQGSGKTFLINQLKEELGETRFAFYDGSSIIASVISGGLNAFQTMSPPDQTYWRGCVIDKIKKDSVESGKVAVVAGHLMLWSEEHKTVSPIYTRNDLETYTHILYLDADVDVVAQRRLHDTGKRRPSMSVSDLQKWQQEEKKKLVELCRSHGILFSLLSSSPSTTLVNKVSTLLEDFRCHNERYNVSRAECKLDEIIINSKGQLKTVLVIDADRTLAVQDTGLLFWRKVNSSRPSEYPASTLTELFSSCLGYSYVAFRQAVLLYEECADAQEFEALCQDIASAVIVYPEFLSLLRLVADQEHVRAVVVTSGLRRIWEMVLERKGLSEKVHIIGGGRISDGFIVSAAVKGALVARLRKIHHICVWAFGDSPLDLDMLHEADRAFVVVGEEQNRSKKMDAALEDAIHNKGLKAHQILLPSDVSPRLDPTTLPQIELSKLEFFGSLMKFRYKLGALQVFCFGQGNAAKLLATKMRNAAVAGPDLREAHRRVGWYLATECVSHVVGLEECDIHHVLNHPAKGYQLFHEKETTIVALMRGGEPMAFGVSDAFPLAMFLHARKVKDVTLDYVKGQSTVILVDSVVNTGESIIKFVRRVRELHTSIRIIVVTGVVQAECILSGSLKQSLGHDANLCLMTLRLSDTKFKGSGANDTGNRLFSTTRLE